jgi:hypothetical protein
MMTDEPMNQKVRENVDVKSLPPHLSRLHLDFGRGEHAPMTFDISIALHTKSLPSLYLNRIALEKLSWGESTKD